MNTNTDRRRSPHLVLLYKGHMDPRETHSEPVGFRIEILNYNSTSPGLFTVVNIGYTTVYTGNIHER
jgi:hypothetical protein